MSWLFCCGSSDAQKQKEKNNTFDLSKPIMLPAKAGGGFISEDGLDELSGKPSA